MLNLLHLIRRLDFKYSLLNTVCKVPIMEKVSSPHFEQPNVRTLRSRKPIKSEAETNPKNSDKGKALKTNEPRTKKAPASKKLAATIKKEVLIKSEPVIKVTVKAEVCSDDDGIDVSKGTVTEIASKTQQKSTVSPRKRKIKTEIDSVKTKKEQVPLDIEDVVWQPENWRKVLDNILEMRRLHVAPVDSLGCEECPEKGIKPEIFRYQTLISVMLSSQTRDEVTYAATQRLIEHGLNIDSILNTPDEIIGQLIFPAGFWKSKVKYIKNASRILKDQYNGDIPRTFKELCSIPGVGPKMANIVMSVAWNDTVGIAVDTHVHRISNRLGWVPEPTKNPEQTRKALESWLPKKEWMPINVTLVGFGQTICRPIGPSCDTCLNSNICPYGRSALAGKHKKKLK